MEPTRSLTYGTLAVGRLLQVYRLFIRSSVEERMLMMARRKIALDSVFKEDGPNQAAARKVRSQEWNGSSGADADGA